MLRQTLKYDPEYARWREPYKGMLRMPAFESHLDFRQYSNTFMRAFYEQYPPQPSITRTKYTCVSHDGAKVEIVRFATAEQIATDQALPALLNMHGGGFVTSSVDIFAPQIATLAAESGVQIFSIDYRLAPEHPDPTPIEDCYAALKWVSTHAAELGVDPSRLGIMGDSAGGGLTAGLGLIARDRGLEPPLKKQILVYPMLDDRSINKPSAVLDEFASFPMTMNKLCWEAYVGKEKAGRSDADVSPYAAPARATDLRGLPSTYIDVGGLDIFNEECALFAARLAAADVEVEFHLFSGLPHGFEGASDAYATKRAIEGRTRWIKDL
ncbi:hypothetical protein F4781DRAFT_102863 [Annulohypoxylon bovei var. microspora]|nr:hypothetical protein F4781DRAFT_102863 [Annulohypoxylon bovei var. microspora]